MPKYILSLPALLLFSTPAISYEVIDNDLAYLHFYGDIKARALILDEQDNDYTFGDSKVGVLGRYAMTDMIAIASGLETQVNFDADEDKNEDDVIVSQYFVGLYAEAIGRLTYGKHNTSSDDLNGIDYSEAFGGDANLNAVGVKGDTIKYVYNNELFTVNATYGFEDGKQRRKVRELFGQYNLADLVIIGGIGKTSTNTQQSQTDATYFQTTARMEMGDTNLGMTYYHQDFKNHLKPSQSADKNAIAVAGQIAFTEGLTGYLGHEVIKKDSSQSNGTRNNSYLGISVVPIEYTKLFAEMNYDAPANSTDELNFAFGAVIVW
ncbi:porin [Vibrio sp. 404]|uniref:Porin n=1 Tax=Vibrio marinisediminis TaxID=2758441 RepID=A0A7W2IUV0_9VIBR|nr:porin [Vibrio marinisediminis]MBA5763779.1 porin [Vibrio marinisediminis]